MKSSYLLWITVCTTTLFPCAFYIENDTQFPVSIVNETFKGKQVIENGVFTEGQTTIQYIPSGNTEQLLNRAQLDQFQKPQFGYINIILTTGTIKSNLKFHIRQKKECLKKHKVVLKVSQIKTWPTLTANAKKEVEKAHANLKKGTGTVTQLRAAQAILQELTTLKKLLRINQLHGVK